MRALIIFLFLLTLNVEASYLSNHVQDQSSVSVTTASTKFLDADPYRVYLLIQNIGTQTIVVKFGSASTASTDGIQIIAGGSYELEKGMTDSVYLISTSGTQTAKLITAR